MSPGMSTGHIDAAAERLEARVLIDTVCIHNGDPGVVTFDPDTLEMIESVAAPYWTGPALIVKQGPRVDTIEAQGLAWSEQPVRIRIPFSAPDIAPDDVVTVVTSRDVQLNGQQFKVLDAHAATFAVSRHVATEHVTRS